MVLIYKTMDIYPTPLIDLRKAQIGIEEMSITYCQPLDDCQEGDHDIDTQRLTISTESSGACVGSDEIDEGKNEDGFYLTIKTDRWAIDDENDLAELIRDFKARLHVNKPKKQTKK